MLRDKCEPFFVRSLEADKQQRFKIQEINLKKNENSNLGLTAQENKSPFILAFDSLVISGNSMPGAISASRYLKSPIPFQTVVLYAA